MNAGAGRLPRAIVVMGVSGVGKTTLARSLAQRLGYAFIEGDDLHSGANVEKMAQGQPLDDVDRAPWLQAVAEAVAVEVVRAGAVASCSALKRRYRDVFRDALGEGVLFVCPSVPRADLARRLEMRSEHFMPVTLLDSQFAALEPPDPAHEWAIGVDGTMPVADQVAFLLGHIRRNGH